jgi:hypothetical protein
MSLNVGDQECSRQKGTLCGPNKIKKEIPFSVVGQIANEFYRFYSNLQVVDNVHL